MLFVIFMYFLNVYLLLYSGMMILDWIGLVINCKVFMDFFLFIFWNCCKFLGEDNWIGKLYFFLCFNILYMFFVRMSVEVLNMVFIIKILDFKLEINFLRRFRVLNGFMFFIFKFFIVVLVLLIIMRL